MTTGGWTDTRFGREARVLRTPDRLCKALRASRSEGSALGALNDRAVAGRMLDDIAVAARPSENVELPLRRLAKQAASGDKRRRQKLRQAWNQFKEAERFWRA